MAGVLAFAVAACGSQISDKYVIENEPYTLEPVIGSELLKVTLDEQAVERIGIQVGHVTSSSEQQLVPSGALWMDVDGVFWVYTNPEPNVYLRHRVDVLDDDGTHAILASGPEPGTPVVTVGVPELFGTEVGVGK
jgi:hypothetical protein